MKKTWRTNSADEVDEEGEAGEEDQEAQRKFRMNMDREAEFLLFGNLLFDRRRMKLINAVVRMECAHLALEAVRYRGGISKACGHGLKKSSCPHDPSTN